MIDFATWLNASSVTKERYKRLEAPLWKANQTDKIPVRSPMLESYN